jgi:hypothetical protein
MTPIEHPLDRDWLEIHREAQAHDDALLSLEGLWDLERFAEAMARIDREVQR